MISILASVKGRGISLLGESLGVYFSIHQKWSKLGTLLQTSANEEKMRKKFKKLTVHPVLGPSFDSAFF